MRSARCERSASSSLINVVVLLSLFSNFSASPLTSDSLASRTRHCSSAQARNAPVSFAASLAHDHGPVAASRAPTPGAPPRR